MTPSAIKALFSPPVLAALRNVLSALGLMLGMFGIVALSPDQIDHILSIAQALGTTLGAIAALLGLLTPLVAGGFAAFKASQPQQIKAVSSIAQDPTQSQSDDAKQALIAATIALPEVQTIVTDKKTADAAPSSDVVPSSAVKVINNTSGQDINQ